MTKQISCGSHRSRKLLLVVPPRRSRPPDYNLSVKCMKCTSGSMMDNKFSCIFFAWINYGQMLKYGVVRMHDLVQDIMNWERCYLSGRLQKPVCLPDFSFFFSYVSSFNLYYAIDISSKLVKILSILLVFELRALKGFRHK
ncbi:hypothetical protein Patl1_12112 [Pistacia atlantica]|uniref:Uncharacterized protein n=1 Tax=Pistacia atlantica TaxID=434234 RepID=A0ACC1A1J3_9ROSI|nr:hypothetical protein Patl1_12112 [Pistacia atlantica]